MKKIFIFLSIIALIVGCNTKRSNTSEPSLGLTDSQKGLALADYAMKQQIRQLRKNKFNDESLNIALKVSNEIILNYPDSIRYLKFKGKILLWKNDYGTYIKFCKNTMDKYDDQAGIYASMGHAFYLLGDSLQARKYYYKSIMQYDQQIEKNSGNTQMMFNRAFMFNFMDNKNRAIEELEKYRKLFPCDF